MSNDIIKLKREIINMRDYSDNQHSTIEKLSKENTILRNTLYKIPYDILIKYSGTEI